jgi:hypothetical protein
METNLITPENPLFQAPVPTPKKTLDKKILILAILGAVIFVLLLLSLILNTIRNTPISRTTTPTPTMIPVTPTTEVKNIPTQYQAATDQIDTELKTNLEFLPPQIDETIGQ